MEIINKKILVLREYKGETLYDQDLPENVVLQKGETVHIKNTVFLIRNIDHRVYRDDDKSILLTLYYAYSHEEGMDNQEFDERNDNEWSGF